MRTLQLSALLLLGFFIASCSEQQPPAETAPMAPPAAPAQTEAETELAPAGNDEKLTIVVFGASGNIGGLIAQEAIDRGHRVIGISRSPEKLAFEGDNFSATSADLSDVESVKTVLADADAAIVSVTGIGPENLPETSTNAVAAKTMVDAYTDDEAAPHVIQIGGASTMFRDTEVMLANYPFPTPEGSRPRGLLFGQVLALETYEASTIPWTVLTPPPMIIGYSPDGIVDKTSKGYRTATEFFVMSEEGKPSPVMVMDLAKAAIDEAENQAFVGQRFTVGM